MDFAVCGGTMSNYKTIRIMKKMLLKVAIVIAVIIVIGAIIASGANFLQIFGGAIYGLAMITMN